MKATTRVSKKSPATIRGVKQKKTHRKKKTVNHFLAKMKSSLEHLRKKFHELKLAFSFVTKSSKGKKRH